jgi:hypothetical protein
VEQGEQRKMVLGDKIIIVSGRNEGVKGFVSAMSDALNATRKVGVEPKFTIELDTASRLKFGYNYLSLSMTESYRIIDPAPQPTMALGDFEISAAVLVRANEFGGRSYELQFRMDHNDGEGCSLELYTVCAESLEEALRGLEPAIEAEIITPKFREIGSEAIRLWRRTENG